MGKRKLRMKNARNKHFSNLNSSIQFKVKRAIYYEEK